ncbi:SGNH/GDSL hydrolase family protein [Actinoplanes sp. NPDC026619]|uniref:SGNH/GDSL hydrolase family protein n=1 Tax=Actinoplanes sp. NPDC026619 TaxID=3155798 RepID=UPI0033D3C1BD
MVYSTARRLAAIAVACLGTFIATPANAAVPAQVYVAMGDSFASGPLILPQEDLGCSRSAINYPHLLAKRLGASSFTDVSCDSAGTIHFTTAQQRNPGGITYPDAPPQFDALSAGTTLVTMTIGGNDTGLVGVAGDCVNLLPVILGGKLCRDRYVVNGVDSEEQVIAQFGVKLATALDQIHAKSPKARVVLTGYGLYLRPNGCWPSVPVLPTDANYLQAKVDSMNATIKATALAHRAEYVDLRTPSAGHDACADAATKWIEGYIPSGLAAPLHPNKAGEAAFAQIIGDYLAAHPA